MSTGWIVLGVIVVLVLFAFAAYNRLVSLSQRDIDMTGVIPLPPERKRKGPASSGMQVKVPFGPLRKSVVPTLRLSCSQLDI